MILIWDTFNFLHYSTFKDHFRFKHNFHLSGISSESLASYSDEYARIGTLHNHLLNFVRSVEKNTSFGSVYRSFMNGLKSYLKHYHEEIISKLNITEKFTAISLYSNLKLTMDQIKLNFF